MAPVRGSDPSLVRSEFGPTLPALLLKRRGIAPWVTLAAVAVVLAAVALVLYLNRADTAELTHGAEPPFTMLYTPSVLKRVDAQRGELFALQARRRGVVMSVTVRPFRLAPHRGFAGGVLPLYADGHITTLRGRFENFDLHNEGKTRIHNATGYEVGFRAGSSQRRRIYGRDILFVTDKPGARDGVIVSLLQRNTGTPLSGGDLRAIKFASKAVGSFRFGS